MHVFYGHYIDLNINYKDKKKSKYKKQRSVWFDIFIEEYDLD